MQEGPHPAASTAHATRTQCGLYSRRPEARGMVHSARWLSCRAPFDHLCLLPLLLLVQCILPQYGGGIEPDLCAGRRWHGVHLAGLQRQLSRQLLLSLQAVLCSKITMARQAAAPATGRGSACRHAWQEMQAPGRSWLLGCNGSPAAATCRCVVMPLQLLASYAAGGFIDLSVPNLTPSDPTWATSFFVVLGRSSTRSLKGWCLGSLNRAC